jgi:hypothetical protein
MVISANLLDLCCGALEIEGRAEMTTALAYVGK